MGYPINDILKLRDDASLTVGRHNVAYEFNLRICNNKVAVVGLNFIDQMQGFLNTCQLGVKSSCSS